MRNIITTMKTTLEGINGILDDTEEWLRMLEFKTKKITEAEQNNKKEKGKEKKNENNFREIWDNIKHTYVHIIEVSEGEERKRKNIFEHIIAENFSNDIQVQETQIGSTHRRPHQDEL